MSQSGNAMVSREVTCPLCEAVFTYYTPRAHSASLLRRDNDFCPYYSGPNPLYYLVWVCPSCKFAAYKDDFKTLEPRSLGPLRDLLKADQLGMAVNYNQVERSLFAALRSFQLALNSYTARSFPAEVRAGVALRAGWMCRYSGELRRELGFLEMARDLYKEAFEGGLRRDKHVDDLQVAFLIGELMLRTGKIPDAMRYFMLLIQAPDAKDNLGRSAKDRLYDSKQAVRVKEILDDIALLGPMGDQGRGLLAVNTEIKSFKPGTTVCTKGEAGESMYVIASGKVRVYLDDPAACDPVAVLGAGDTIGEMSLFTGEPRSATVVAGDDAPHRKGQPEPYVELIEIRKPAVRNLLKVVPEVAQGVAEKISSRKAQNAGVPAHVAAGAPAEAPPREVAAAGASDAAREHEQSILLDKIKRFFGVHAEE
ncbi:MAG: DUF2225 domain-containing protein [Candidatus Sericytochromatia bacterium]|nr:DUF2225 domain-containing protein [Candidatus Tanganyikabacteria bacterium]